MALKNLCARAPAGVLFWPGKAHMRPMTEAHATHDPTIAAARGRCPRCNSGRLFEGFLKPAEECEACGLDLRFEDSGDGPVVFVVLIVGFVVIGLALWAEVAHGVSLLFHFTVWPLLIVALTLPLMRVLKGAMIGQQYRMDAAEGRAAMREPRP